MDLGAIKNSEIGARLRSARETMNLTREQFAELTGMKLPSLRDYELCNRIPGGAAIASFARAGVNANWLLTGEGEMLLPPRAWREASAAFFGGESSSKGISQPAGRVEKTDDVPGFVAIPLFDVRAAAGGGSIVESEHVMDVLHFKEEWIRAELRASPADLHLIFVDGESMEPTLRPGDIILVDRRDQAQRRDGIYVLRLDGTLLVKRLQKLPGGNIKVSSDNKSYDPFTLRLEEMEAQDMAIIGRVIWVGRKF